MLPMPLSFALDCQRLQRQGLTIPAIARALKANVADVWEAHRVLALPVNDTDDPVRYLTANERAAQLKTMPKRMQDRIRQSRD